MSDADKPWWHEIEDVRQQIERSTGARVVAEIRALGRTVQVFMRNNDELLRSLEPLVGPMGPIFFSVGQDASLEGLLDDIDHRLHNFLAAVKSLVDHTRVMVQQGYSEASPFRDSYEKRKDATFLSPRSQFVQKLRDYTLHRRLPNPVGTLTMTQGAYRCCPVSLAPHAVGCSAARFRSSGSRSRTAGGSTCSRGRAERRPTAVGLLGNSSARTRRAAQRPRRHGVPTAPWARDRRGRGAPHGAG